MLVGIWNLGAIILIFAVNATMNLFGIMMEYHNQYTKKGQLALIHLWQLRWDCSLDCDHDLLPECNQFHGRKSSRICLCHHPNHLCVFQYFCSEYGAAIQEGWRLKRLSFCRKILHRTESAGKNRFGLDDFCWYLSTRINYKK